jgi:hypothetical protein
VYVHKQADCRVHSGDGFDGQDSIKECAAAAAELLGNFDAHEPQFKEPAEEAGVHLLVLVHAANQGSDLLPGKMPDRITEQSFVFAEVGYGPVRR